MSEHEIFHSHGASTSLTFSGDELKVKETDFSSGYGVRVLKDKRLGFAYCQDESGLDDAIGKAGRLSRFSVESGFSFAPKAGFSMPDVLDESLDPADFGMLKGLVDEAREAAASFGGKPKVIASAADYVVKLENTEGFSGEYRKTEFSLYVECMHGDGFGYAYLSSNKRPGSVRELGLEAAGMARDLQGAKKPEAGSYTVVLELEALESILGTILPSFSGDWRRRGMSKLERGKRFFSEQLEMVEDGLASGSDARPFDDEGTPSSKQTLIREGVVEGFLYDRETAALSDKEGSGSCSRSTYDSQPTIGSSNISISPGDYADLGEIGRHIELHYAHGSHTANVTTGDIGLEVSGAFLVGKGGRTPLKGFMLTGNVFDWFRDIEGMERKVRTLEWLNSPRIAIRDVHAVS